METKHPRELPVVILAYIEAEGISEGLSQWIAELSGLSVYFDLLIYEDRSTDETGQTLEDLPRSLPRLSVTQHSNRGNGPTILRGHHEVEGAWILQIDDDNKIPANQLPKLWQKRQVLSTDGLPALRSRGRSH